MRICIFDTETTGLPTGGKAPWFKTEYWPYIVQISWLVYDTEQGCVVDDKDRIIKIDPNIEITPKSIEKHGITMERSQASEYLMKDVLIEFGNAIKRCDILVAHNIVFDDNVIKCEYHRNNIMNFMDKFRGEKYCTMRKSEKICKIQKVWPNGNVTYKWPTLDELHYFYFRNNPTNLHNSLVDIFVCFRCFYKLKFDKDVLREDSGLRAYYNSLCQKRYTA
jgi:DNA polymerase III epsilon subunit-like protein